VSGGAIAVLVILVLALVAILGAVGWDRYRPRTLPQRPVPTTEVFLDPVTHRRMRVWTDPATGAREYREELETTATVLPPHDPSLLMPPSEPPRQLPPPPPPPPGV
jgi:hypothetical protein